MGFFRNLFGGASSGSSAGRRAASERVQRRSTGFHEFIRGILRPDGQTVLDLGPTSPANLQFITGLGHRAYNEDILVAANDPALMISGEDPGSKTIDVEAFLRDNLKYEPNTFDAVLLWDACDYLPEPLVKPVIEHIYKVTKPKGLLLGFFHTKDAGSDAPYCRYHIAAADTLELQAAQQFRLQRVFNNRHIENLFHDYTSLKFFLGRDNIREVLIIR
ncbi:MAG TPA: class I SAM-dependent methyltransferase [Clostridia bacterium]|nr:class I SAM-dependent methyltransferase [Clostridia bacterium]